MAGADHVQHVHITSACQEAAPMVLLATCCKTSVKTGIVQKGFARESMQIKLPSCVCFVVRSCAVMLWSCTRPQQDRTCRTRQQQVLNVSVCVASLHHDRAISLVVASPCPSASCINNHLENRGELSVRHSHVDVVKNYLDTKDSRLWLSVLDWILTSSNICVNECMDQR